MAYLLPWTCQYFCCLCRSLWSAEHRWSRDYACMPATLPLSSHLMDAGGAITQPRYPQDLMAAECAMRLHAVELPSMVFPCHCMIG